MGDTGSNLLGYLLGCIAIQGALKTSAVAALFFPLIVLAVPIFDTGFVVAKRLKYRRPIYEADRWHLHHRMANLGFSQRKTLAYLYAWALIMAGLGLAFRFVPYSDDRGNFDPGWTIVILICVALAARGERLPRGGTRDPQAPRGALRASSRPWRRARSTRASPASSRPALSRRSTRRPANSAPWIRKPESSTPSRRPERLSEAEPGGRSRAPPFKRRLLSLGRY